MRKLNIGLGLASLVLAGGLSGCVGGAIRTSMAPEPYRKTQAGLELGGYADKIFDYMLDRDVAEAGRSEVNMNVNSEGSGQESSSQPYYEVVNLDDGEVITTVDYFDYITNKGKEGVITKRGFKVFYPPTDSKRMWKIFGYFNENRINVIEEGVIHLK